MNDTEKLKLLSEATSGLITALHDSWYGGQDNQLTQTQWAKMVETVLATVQPSDLQEPQEAAVAQKDDWAKWVLPQSLHWEWKPEWKYKWGIWDDSNHGIYIPKDKGSIEGWLPSPEWDKDMPMLTNLLRERNGIVKK